MFNVMGTKSNQEDKGSEQKVNRNRSTGKERVHIDTGMYVLVTPNAPHTHTTKIK